VEIPMEIPTGIPISKCPYSYTFASLQPVHRKRMLTVRMMYGDGYGGPHAGPRAGRYGDGRDGRYGAPAAGRRAGPDVGRRSGAPPCVL
jgi:hypothetical protein